MKIRNLFIIGNGFDLGHGFETSYDNFGEYLTRKLKDNGNEYKDLTEIVNVNYYNLKDEKGYTKWGEIEAAFYEQCFSHDINDLILRSQVSKEEYLRAWKVFKNYFVEWVSLVNKDIKNSKYKFNDYKYSHYINFNYTDTLQNIHKISNDKVTHIHGQVSSSEPLIFGTDSDFKRYEDIRKMMEKSAASEKDRAILEPFYKEEEEKVNDRGLCDLQFDCFSKHCEKNINDKLSPLDLYDVENIYILGHSLNDHDLKYFEYIFEEVKKPFKVKCSFYSDDEKSYFREKLTGICKDDGNMMKLKERFERVYNLEESDVEMMKMKDILTLKTEKEVDCKMNTA